MLHLVPCTFNIFLEQIMSDSFEDFTWTVKGGGRQISNLRFADDIDLIAGSREELEILTNWLDTTDRSYDIRISVDKSEVMVTSRLIPMVQRLKWIEKHYKKERPFRTLAQH